MEHMRTCRVLVSLTFCMVLLVDFSSSLTDMDNCYMEPCLNGGTCYDFPRYYLCTCPQKYEGKHCEKERGFFHNKRYYWHVSSSGTWMHFLKLCHQQGGTLAVFHDGATEKAVLKSDGFIGLSAVLSRGIWRWTDTATTIGYENFMRDLPFHEDNKYVLATRLGWSTVRGTDEMNGAWCMELDVGVTCGDLLSGCLLYHGDYFKPVENKSLDGDLVLAAISGFECKSLCLYNTLIVCTWYYFSSSMCSLGTGAPVSGNYTIFVRIPEDLSRGKCHVEVGAEAMPYASWDVRELVYVDSDKTLAQAQALLGEGDSMLWTGLSRTQYSSWSYPDGQSPVRDYFADNWIDDPTGGSECVAVTIDGLVSYDCSASLNAVLAVPGSTSDCSGSPTINDTISDNRLTNGVAIQFYICTVRGQKFEMIGTKHIEKRCPCDADWTNIIVPPCVVYDECASNPCENGGTCVDDIDGYVCTCPTGVQGLKCNINLNECDSFPCQNDGTCLDNINFYICVCNMGTLGSHCQTHLGGNSLLLDKGYDDFFVNRGVPATKRADATQPTSWATTTTAFTLAPQPHSSSARPSARPSATVHAGTLLATVLILLASSIMHYY